MVRYLAGLGSRNVATSSTVLVATVIAATAGLDLAFAAFGALLVLAGRVATLRNARGERSCVSPPDVRTVRL